MSVAMSVTNDGPPRSFRRYPDYRDTEVEWLGQIPAHWGIKRLKYLASINPESLPEDTDPALEMSYVDIGGVSGTGQIIERESLTFGSAPSRARRLVRDGDVIVSTVRTYLRAIASISKPDPGLVVSTGFGVVRPTHEVTSGFAAYALRSPYFVERVVANSTGVSFPAINESVMSAFDLAVPPESEQLAIAAFLERETARIDALIAKKQQLIELLEERRTAIITRAVTKGLDPSAPMRHSGVEWLGKIPAHWEPTRLKYLVVEPLRYGANEPAELSDPELPRYIRITDIRDDGTLRSETFRSLPEGVAEPHLLADGDVLFARSGATVGKTFRYDLSWGRAAHAGYLIRARLDPTRANPRFVHYFTQSEAYSNWLSRTFIQATIENVSADKYASLLVPVPSLGEQVVIVAYLDDGVGRLQRLQGTIREAISRLHELRTALISAAVTGKIDVRDEALGAA